MELQEWRVVAASVVGTSHVKNNSPCQDSNYSKLTRLPDDSECLVLIASDGAGSATFSDIGSRLACDELANCIEMHFAEGRSVAEIQAQTARAWLQCVADAIGRLATAEGNVQRDYACTVLAAVVSPSHAAYLQVGDGAIVVRSGSDEWSYVFWPQHGEYINTTVFVTDPAALDNFHFEVKEGPVHEIAAFTDGIESLVLHYATNSVHGPFFDSIFPPVRASADAGAVLPELCGRLATYLASSEICSRTDDDKTLLLASRLKRPPSRALVVIEKT